MNNWILSWRGDSIVETNKISIMIIEARLNECVEMDFENYILNSQLCRKLQMIPTLSESVCVLQAGNMKKMLKT